MHWIDWVVLITFLAYTVWDGTRKGKQSQNINDYLMAGRNMPWWAAGLSVMATQASAITFIGTTGIAYTEDMRFVQVYLAIPFAMILICIFLVPFFHKMKAFTAYETLEARFGLKTRLTTSGLFLISRGLPLGAVIAAPSYVLSLMLGLPLTITILIMGLLATVYTMIGGVAGVISTDVKQMFVMMFGLVFCFIFIIFNLPKNVAFEEALYLAGSLNKLTALDWNFDFSERYSVWSGVFAALFLMLSYFGTDQTQVQRYLTTPSIEQARKSLLVSAYAKIPMQFLILLLGVMLYVFFIFNDAPISFRANDAVAQTELHKIQKQTITQEYSKIQSTREVTALRAAKNPTEANQQLFLHADGALNEVRQANLNLQAEITQTNVNDTNYIFPYFILNYIPIGLVGLIIAGIFAAAMSSIDSELNALTTVSIVDWYKRLDRDKHDESHYLKNSRWVTLAWGVLATGVALMLGETKSIIELINQIGSFFYGSILGVFILMLWFKKSNGTGALIGLFSGMFTVFSFDRLYFSDVLNDYSFFLPWTHVPETYSKALEFLWLNPVGAFTVVIVGMIVSLFFSKK